MSTKFPWDHPPPIQAPNVGGIGKKCVSRPVEKSPAQTPCRRQCLSIRHDGPRPRRCTGGGIRGVINNAGGSQSVLIQLTSTRLVVWKSVDDTHGSLQRYMNVTSGVTAYRQGWTKSRGPKVLGAPEQCSKKINMDVSRNSRYVSLN